MGAPGRRPAQGSAAPVDPARRRDTLLWLLVPAAALCWVTFYARGGIKLETMTVAEMALTLGSAVAGAMALLRTPAQRRWHGVWPLVLMGAFAAFTALSIAWSVQPDDSWVDAGRMFAYTAVFALAVTLARLAPDRWEQLLGAVALAMLVVCCYALLTKVIPSSLDSSDIHARLEQPFGYWNATGLAAAMGILCWLWIGSRRSGHPLLGAVAYPAVGLLIVTLMLAYSRGALAALAAGLALWFAAVPLRLRGAAVLAAGAVGAGAVVVWDFSTNALTEEGVELARRATAGHQLGVALLAMVLALTAVGVAARFATDRRSPSPQARHAAGMAIAVLAGLAVLSGIGALAASNRGLTGTISHTWNSLTDPNAKAPPNTAGRLTAVASVRARYWKEALEVWKAHPAAGAGAEGYATARLRYRKAPLDVRHAHGFIVQTLADLGLIGLLIGLALLAAWMAAAGRATHPFNRRWTPWSSWLELTGFRRGGAPGSGELGRRPGWRRLEPAELTGYTPERIGLLSMICVVVVFGVHSLVDWTWYVPGDACVALLCAGWLAGRGPLAPAGAADSALPAGAAPATGDLAEDGHYAVTAPYRPIVVRTHELRVPRITVVGLLRALEPLGRRQASPLGRRGTWLVAAATIVAALLAAWSQWQPLRAEDASQRALAQLAGSPRAAEASALSAVSHDPLSEQALFTLARVQSVTRGGAQARTTLERAVRLQPSNPQTWLALGRNDVAAKPAAAVRELRAAIYLDPESIEPEALERGLPIAVETETVYIEALRGAAKLRTAREQRARAARAARRAARRRHAHESARSQNPGSSG